MSNPSTIPDGYADLLIDLKERVRSSQLRATLSVNRELIALYWDTGRSIVEQQRQHNWGDLMIDRLSRDLRLEFPEMAGFSRQNLYRMRAFYLGYACENSIVSQPVRQLRVRSTKSHPKGSYRISTQTAQPLSAATVKQLKSELDGKNLSSAP
jgi:DUF1016 N-terminal domain